MIGSQVGTPRALVVLPLALVAYAVLAVGYARLTPIWQNPDEPAHFNYVEYVASTGGLPELKPGDWDSALLERLKTGALQPGDSVASIRYEGWQPPLFYLAAAPVVALGGTADVPAAVMRLRLFDAVLGGVTVVLGYLVAREVLPVALAVAVPVVMAGVPMFAAVSASVSADPLANLLAAAALLYLVWRLRRSVNDWRWPLGAGALIGLGMLTKLALAIFVPLALGVVVLRAARPARETVLMLATAAVVMLPWLVHQVTTYGWTDPLALNRHSAVVLDQPRFPGLSPEYVVDFATTTFHSFWAQFGWMAVVAPARLYWTWGVLTLIGVAGFLRARACLSKPAWKLMIATVLTAGIAYVGYNLTFEQFQGRYLFVALAPLAILLVLGWAAWVPGRAQAWVTLLAAAGLVVLNAYALLRVLVPGFAPGPLTLLG